MVVFIVVVVLVIERQVEPNRVESQLQSESDSHSVRMSNHCRRHHIKQTITAVDDEHTVSIRKEIVPVKEFYCAL